MNYAAIQSKLNAFGASPSLDVDGQFGPKSKAALAAFQNGHGLPATGTPDAATLKALGISAADANGPASTMGHVSPQSAATDKNAYQVALRAAPTMSEAQRQYVLAVARGEGHYGVGWQYPSAKTIADSQAHGLTGYEGVGSNNWGAIQGTGDAGSFPHMDSHADGSLYVGTYKKYSKPELGFLDTARIILGGGKRGAAGSAEIKAAIDRGDVRGAVEAQHANGYFELAPDKYLTAVSRNYADLTSVIGWKQALGAASGAAGGITTGGKILLLALAAGGVLLATRKG